MGIIVKFNTIGYLIGEGFRNTFKNKKSTLSAMLVMCISMLMFGFFFIVGENVDHIRETVEDAQAIQVFIELDKISLILPIFLMFSSWAR